MRNSRPPRDTVPPPSGSNTRSEAIQTEHRYLVKAELASGGMGVVYRVLDRVAGEDRALKRIKPSAARQALLVEAFEREYQVLAGLEHPRIIRVFDYGVDDLGPYYTMELLEGQDMRHASPLPIKEACLYLRDVATSLALLHARRLIHRDLSPTNVRKTPDGHCKLLDFGALAAFGYSRLVVGTAPGIPPEALGSAPLDQRADLYALGALGYFMLTGRHAYPAKRIEELSHVWQESPPAPSQIAEDVPGALDALVLSMLSADPLARPASAAEVIARLNVIAELPQEDHGEIERLAESFLLRPRFIGRTDELQDLRRRAEGAVKGSGGAVRIEAIAGMGRTRFLEEIGVYAQLAGASVLRLDASMFRQAHGTTRALVLRALEALPDQARDAALRHRGALSQLGRDVEALLPPRPSPLLAGTNDAGAEPTRPLEGWFVEISRGKPLVIEVDNIEYADPASLGFLAALAHASAHEPMLVVFTERVRRDPPPTKALLTLQSHCDKVQLLGLDPERTLELSRSLFGDAPNVQRFAEWLHGSTAGSPLHCVEISRQLVRKGVIRYFGGLWVLPTERPLAGLPAALEDALSVRLDSLGDQARGLAECLSLQRERPTRALCRLLAHDLDDRQVGSLLTELERNDVLYEGDDGYRFSSTALREALFSGMPDSRRVTNHRRLGEAFAALAGPDDAALRIEAGWHLIKGGEELKGAAMIAAVARNSVTMRTLIANLHHAGRPIEAALKVYKRHRRSVVERMPLLAALAHAGYYEDRAWGEQYGDEALDALEDVSGLRAARSLRRFVGRRLSLVFGMFFGFIRFYLVPERDRQYSFAEVMVQLFGAVTTLTGTASLSLDVTRAARVAEVLEPFSVLPERLTPVGIYQFCISLQEIGREHTVSAMRTFETLIRRFEDPKYYPTLPQDARRLYWTGAHFARGAFAVMRNDGREALESAVALDSSGLKMYAMIASQLRFLYHVNRGEFDKAASHREQVELHAAQVGSAWQVELWEAPALIAVYAGISDLVATARIADQIETHAKTVPSLTLYSHFAEQALSLVRKDSINAARLAITTELAGRPPRSFVGWAATHGLLARGENEAGRHAVAKTICEEVLTQITDEDREYVSLFLQVDIEAAIADAGLGDNAEGLKRLDGLLARFVGGEHPLVLGRLHEARARIAWACGMKDAYEVSLGEVERWFRPTGAPTLIAKYERLAELSRGPKAVGSSGGAMASSTAAAHRSQTSLEPAPPTSEAKSERDAETVRALATRRESA